MPSVPRPPHGEQEPVIPNYLFTLVPYRYYAKKQMWKHVSAWRDAEHVCPCSIRIVTWNVDFQSPLLAERLKAVLRHLELEVLQCANGEAPDPCCIMLQEVNGAAFDVLLADEWVRRHFVVLPKSMKKWMDPTYGNVTLVSRTLRISKAQIVHFGHTRQGRTGVMVDVVLKQPASEPEAKEVTLRFVNTHLESLPPGWVARQRQMALLADMLRDKEVRGGVIAGDMNAINESDQTLVAEMGLKDAWLRGDEDMSGFTWGFQGGGTYPAARLDKVVYLPRRVYKVDEPRRIGIGVRTEGELFASDHYGLTAILSVLNRPTTSTRVVG